MDFPTAFIRDLNDFKFFMRQLEDHIEELQKEEFNGEDLNDLQYDYDQLEIEKGELELIIEDLNRDIGIIANTNFDMQNKIDELEKENNNFRQIIIDLSAVV